MNNTLTTPWNMKVLQTDYSPFDCEKYLSNMIKDYMEPNYIKYLNDNVFNNTSIFNKINNKETVEIVFTYDIVELVMNPDKFNSAIFNISLPYPDHVPWGITRNNRYNMKFIISSNKKMASKSLKIKQIYLDICSGKEIDNMASIKYVNCYFYRAKDSDISKEFKSIFDKFSSIVIPELCDKWISDCKIFLQLDISDRKDYDYNYFANIIKEEEKKEVV